MQHWYIRLYKLWILCAKIIEIRYVGVLVKDTDRQKTNPQTSRMVCKHVNLVKFSWMAILKVYCCSTVHETGTVF